MPITLSVLKIYADMYQQKTEEKVNLKFYCYRPDSPARQLL